MTELRPKFISFDCYGTLTWFRVGDVTRTLVADRVSADRMEAFLKDFNWYRFDEVLGAWKPYVDVLKSSLERTCKRHGVAFREADGQALYEAVPTWGPHPDVAAPLKRVAARYPLVILSNASDDQIMKNVALLEAPFHTVCTAQQAQAYKPRMRAFEYMFDTLGCGPEDVLHVSASLRYDLMPAYGLGIRNKLYVNRGYEPSVPYYEYHETTTIEGLAKLLGLEAPVKLASYWLETATPFAGGTIGPIEGRVDAAVIGGGFTGLSAALALARRGASVVVLEAGRVAAGASGRNGGHVNNGTSHDYASLVASLGAEQARALYRAYDDAVDTVERIVREEQIQCDFRRSGKIKLAAKPAHYDKLARSFETLNRECDPETELIPRERIRDEIGSDAFFGGLLYRKSAMMHMGRFGAGLAEAASRAGARIFEAAPVTALTRLTGSAHRIETPRGTIEAAQVLAATGPSREGPFAWFRRRIVPVGSFIVVTEPLSKARLDAIMPKRRTATTTKHIGNYFRISPDDRLIWGGRARFAMSNPTEDSRSGDVLRAQLRTTFPDLADVRLDYCWGGLVDMTEDRLPRAGEHEGLFYAMGFSGHGAQMSVHLGQQMAKVMAGESEANPLRFLAWNPIAFNYGTPWFLPLVGAWYGFKDRIE